MLWLQIMFDKLKKKVITDRDNFLVTVNIAVKILNNNGSLSVN